MLFMSVRCGAVRCGAVLCCSLLCSSALCFAVLCCAPLCFALLCSQAGGVTYVYVLCVFAREWNGRGEVHISKMHSPKRFVFVFVLGLRWDDSLLRTGNAGMPCTGQVRIALVEY